MGQARLIGMGLVAAAAMSAGCGGDGNGPGGGGTTTYSIHAPAATISAGSDSTVCHFFHLPNTGLAAIKSWQATLSSGVASAALVFTPSDIEAPGTVTTSSCGATGSGAVVGSIILESRVASMSLTMPENDGSGTPVAQVVPAGQSAFLRIRYLNGTTDPINPTVTFTATAYPSGTTVTRADPYLTINGNFSVGIGLTGTVTDSCATPADAKFFHLAMFSHIYANAFSINDGAAPLYSGTDVNNPGAATALTAPFLTFSSNRLTTSCTFNNTSGQVLTSGDSFLHNESCLAIAWFFPSTAAKTCYNSIVVASPGTERMLKRD